MTAWGENSVAALEALASAVGAKPADAKPQAMVELKKPTGALTFASIAQARAKALGILVDLAIHAHSATEGAAARPKTIQITGSSARITGVTRTMVTRNVAVMM